MGLGDTAGSVIIVAGRFERTRTPRLGSLAQGGGVGFGSRSRRRVWRCKSGESWRADKDREDDKDRFISLEECCRSSLLLQRHPRSLSAKHAIHVCRVVDAVVSLFARVDKKNG